MRATRLLQILGLVLGLCCPPPSQAWGKLGHLTVCDLAYRNLTANAKKALQALMHNRDGGITVQGRGRMEDRTYTSFNLGCLEEDEVPRNHPEDHFINVSRDTSRIESGTCPGDQACIFSGIQRDFETLRDTSKSDDERVFALMALGHWIGDIHQPLHVSFADDRGGNRIEVRMETRCGTAGGAKPKNLHAVWDNCLLQAGLFERVRQRADYKTTWGERTLTYRAVDTLQANTTLTNEKSLLDGDPWTWARESYDVTLQPAVAYCIQEGGACRYSDAQATYESQQVRAETIDAAYLKMFAPIAQERVRRAGYRLADMINRALDTEYQGAIANSTQKP